MDTSKIKKEGERERERERELCFSFDEERVHIDRVSIELLKKYSKKYNILN